MLYLLAAACLLLHSRCAAAAEVFPVQIQSTLYPTRVPDTTQSLQTKLNEAVPGDIITFDNAWISSEYLRTVVDGTAENPITVRGIGADAVIYGSYYDLASGTSYVHR